VRFRLTVWYSSLLLVFGLTFVVALNIAARLDQPDLPTHYQLIPIENLQVARIGPGGAVSTDDAIITTPVLLREVESQWQSEYLDRLRNWSIFAVVGLAVASGVGGYVISGVMLQPVRDITQVASEISDTNLSRRINYEGPDDELKQLADTFDSMIGRLESSFERQRQFVQDASHELRTPLTAIRTNIEVTEMDPDATVEDYRSVLETVKGQTDRLARLTEDLLLLTRTEGEAVETEPVDVEALVREVVHALQPLAASRGVDLRVEPMASTEAYASPDLLHRCISNLVDNAIKYGGEGARVTISGAENGGLIEIRVADTGPGISEADLPRLFDRFYRVDRGRSRREGGTGLGLSIVQELMRSQSGSVTVASAPGQGTTFTLTLPAARAPLTFDDDRPLVAAPAR